MDGAEPSPAPVASWTWRPATRSEKALILSAEIGIRVVCQQKLVELIL